MSYRIRIKTRWTGMVDGVERTVEPGEEVDVDIATFRALVFQYNKAEAVTVEEIEEKAGKPAKKKKATGTKASKTKARRAPPKNKMQKEDTVKGG